VKERADWLAEVLRNGFAPTYLEVEDESHQHRGHPGAAGGGGHFRAVIVSPAFEGQTAIARQRAVYTLLGDAMLSTIHALALRTLTPDEWAREPRVARPAPTPDAD
jgi:BolA protein